MLKPTRLLKVELESKLPFKAKIEFVKKNKTEEEDSLRNWQD